MSGTQGDPFTKDPDATLDYGIDFADWLAGSGIASYTVTPDAALAVLSDSRTGAVVSVRLTGGTLGKLHAVRFRVTTDDTPARIDDRTMYLRIKQR